MKGRVVAVTIALVMSISTITANVRWSSAQQGTMSVGEARQSGDLATPPMQSVEETPVPEGDFDSRSQQGASPEQVTIGDAAFSGSSLIAGQVVTPKRPETPAGLVTITHSASQSIISGNSVACNNGLVHTDNHYLREFDLNAFGISGPLAVTQVEFGVEQANGAGGSQPVTVMLYTKINPAAALTFANLSSIGWASATVSDQSLTLLTVPVTGTAPAGSVLVVDVFTPDGQTAGNLFFIGSNNLGQTAPSYLAAEDCGLPEPTSAAAIGFPGMHIVMNVSGNRTISHIEVTQATQNESNSVPLIAGKATFVRVYVDCGEECISRPNVTGVLRGYGPSGQLPGSPLAPIGNPITAFHENWRSQRASIGKTLNFKLPLAWLTGIVTLTAEVSEDTRSEVVTFQPVQSLKVVYVPIHYGGQNPDPTRISTGSGWASRVYPTAKIDYVPGPTLKWYPCLQQGPQCSRADSNTQSLLNKLTTRHRLANAYVYGWLPNGTLNGGTSDPTWFGGAGKAAIGDDHPTDGPLTFAHEIAHLLGRRHANTSSCSPNNIDPDTDWPYVNSLIQDYGLDGRLLSGWVSSFSAVKIPTNTYDYMSYCGSLAENNVWTSGWTYTHLYSEMLRIQAVTMQDRSLSTPQSYFIASGLVYTDDTAILDPAWVITSTVVPDNPPAGAQYCLEAQDASGIALASHCFDLTFTNYETGEATDVDGFNLMLPYPDGVARIVLKKGADELAVQPVSANAPAVTVLSPNGGETWSATGAYTVTWTASDTDGDPLTYSVLYSPDGSDWVPVGTTITQTQLVLNAAELAGSSNARIRVQATDGVNTSRDDSDAAFTVERKAPQAFIISPEADSATLAGTPVWLEGYAYDLEDGALGDAALNWSSSRDGELGSGAQLLTALSLGQHTLTFTAIDSDANTATATVEVLATFAEDVVPDCQVDVVDIQAIASRWQQQSNDPEWDGRFDLDGDGTITVADIMHVAAAWGAVCQ